MGKMTSPQVKYIHGNYGKGTFTFLGGHDPEDYVSLFRITQTDLFFIQKFTRIQTLILNNILFPAAKNQKNIIVFTLTP